jgi:hypothetical protein
LYRQFCDNVEIAVKLIDHFDVEKGSESGIRLEIQNEIDNLMNAMCPFVKLDGAEDCAPLCADRIAGGSSPDFSGVVDSDNEIDCNGGDCARYAVC